MVEGGLASLQMHTKHKLSVHIHDESIVLGFRHYKFWKTMADAVQRALSGGTDAAVSAEIQRIAPIDSIVFEKETTANIFRPLESEN